MTHQTVSFAAPCLSALSMAKQLHVKCIRVVALYLNVGTQRLRLWV
jgi:hypothetical protein